MCPARKGNNTVPDFVALEPHFCCFPLVLANTRLWPAVWPLMPCILSNLFSGLPRALFPTTLLDIAVYGHADIYPLLIIRSGSKYDQNKSSVTSSEKTKSYSVSEN